MTTHYRVPEHYGLVKIEIEEFGLENIYNATYMFCKGIGGDIVEAGMSEGSTGQGFRILIEYSSGFTLGVQYFGESQYDLLDSDGYLIYQHYSDSEFFVLPTFAAFCANTMRLVLALQSKGYLGEDVAHAEAPLTSQPLSTIKFH